MAELDRLEIAVEAQASKANSELDKLVKKLDKVSGSLNGINASGLQGLANGIQKLSTAMQGMNNVKTTDFSRLAKNIEKLGSINQSGINSTASALRQISNALNGTSGMTSGAAQITALATSLSKLGYKSVSNAITNIPLMAKALNELMTTLSKSPRVSSNLIQMTNALANLAAQGSKVKTATNGINSTLNKYASSTQKAESKTRSFASSLATLYAKFYVLKRGFDFIGKSIEKSMDFGETINLFQTSFKKIGMEAAQASGLEWGSQAADKFAVGFIDKAQAFNDKLVNALSLDPDTTMNYQAVFASMTNAFGLANKSVMDISESFTMLGLDISSLFNTSVDEAMTKLKAGLAGETEPLRALGIDVTEATLKMTAMNYGITDNISKMSMAAKTQLRYLAIMDQAEVAYGDMAKSINSPANQLRILRQQWNNLSRSIGNVFMPIVATVLPYINALVIALRRMIDTLAKAVGFELPDYKDTKIYSGVADGIATGNDAIADSADKADKATKKLQKTTQSFDQLHILQAPDSDKSKSGGSGAGGGSGYPQLDDAIAGKTASYMKKFNEELANMGDGAEKMADKITGFFKRVADAAEPTLKALKKLKDEGLAKLGDFTFGALSDFYNDYLVPLGKWTLGKGLPEFIEITNNFLKDVDWEAIRKALDRFWKALEPFAENIGEGLLSFYKDLMKIGAKFINKTVPGGVNGLAAALEKIDPENVRSIGYALGVFAVGVSSIKIKNKLLDQLDKLAFRLKYMPRSTRANIGLTIALVAAGVAFNFIKEYIEATPAERKKMMEDMWSGDYRFTVIGDFKLPSKNDIDTAMDALIQPLKDKFNIKIPVHIDPFRNLEELFKSGAKIGKDAADKTNNIDMSGTWKDIQDWWGDKYLGIKTKLETTKADVNSWWDKDVVPWWGEKYLLVKSKLATIKSDVEKWWTGSVVPWWSERYLSVKSKLSTLKSDVVSWWTDKVVPWWGEKNLSVKSTFATAESTVRAWGKSISDWWDRHKPDLSALTLKIKLPKISISWDTSGALGKAADKLGLPGVPNFSVSYYAKGGLPNTGEMFVARENGIPEMVGRMGNSNAVANNSQIEAGIEEAAYRGYMRAMMESGNTSGSNSNQNIMVESNLYVDSEKMYSISQKGKAKSERRYQTTMQPV